MARPRTGQARPLEDALLSPRTLLLANDNDSGIDGIATRFRQVALSGNIMME